jgi:inner membrane protein
MGDFHEHVLFGFFTASVVSFLLRGYIDLTTAELLLSVTMLVIGSVLPDIDHKNSYVHRAAKAFVSVGSAALSLVILPFPVHVNFVFAAAIFLLIYTSVSSMKITHRGFTHSIGFLTVFASLSALASTYLYASAVPGLAIGLGIFSHLLLDSEFKFA